jgi:uncharacterized membrane protein YgdD (TMEM256/DUF423 family)
MSGRLSGLWLALAGVNGGIAVATGAYATHGLADRAAELFRTASQYQMWHALALVGVALLARQMLPRAAQISVTIAGAAFLIGTMLFCGSLYRLALHGRDALSMLAPYGGTSFMLGWLALTIAGLLWLHRPAG